MAHNLTLLRISWSCLDILIVGAFANWASGAAMHRKITRQSRWNLSRASDKAIPNQASGMVGEGVETGWRASLVDEGTVRLSSKGESDRITQRSAVQIRPPQPMNATAEMQWRSPFTEPSDHRFSHLYVEPRRYSGYVTGTTNADSQPGRPMRCTRF